MSTGQSIINRALRLIGAVASGESPTTQESADALEALNHLLGSWRAERLLVYSAQTEQLAMVPGTGTYTIGPSGDLDTVRPVRVDDAYINVGGRDYPLTVVDQGQWNALPDKTLTDAYPEWLLYSPLMPVGVVRLFPVPATASTLNLVTWVVLEELALATTLTLPPGYERALTYNLAIDLAPEFEKEVPKAVQVVANDSLASIKRANNRPIGVTRELAMLLEHDAA